MEETLREFLGDVFQEYEIVCFNGQKDEVYTAEVNCNLNTSKEIQEFVTKYTNEFNECLKLKYKKEGSNKSLLKVKEIYRCHHDTRYEKTRDVDATLKRNPLKRFKNTSCPFQISFKIYNELPTSGFSSKIYLEHTHNHPLNSLEALSFKSISDEVKSKINELFSTGLTPSHAYREFLRNLKNSCQNELDFHLKKSDRSKCPRRRDFNSIYLQYCKELFGGRNGLDMFDKLEEKINELKSSFGETSIKYQIYDKDTDSAFILTIITPLMRRVHSMVSA